ncbi:hypothetical protein EYZ11_002674 [Aspergillus tanneri]|uniref:Uncharacterized protein n=1 Tax=Aspergillus tanneri TaxID=1220188 RepID=A0A4S3JU04_9EURO|nr:uncharacterized protein ATNIH1004_004010 [Aspergillus tanneri]KAA8648127.1 hypothetical protein ATNIH1004_004010 [Aspergillus tanneri]THC97821.1 hypothetical protein EYZ11_002674 [Aspergillus tanneri]
MPSSSSTSPTSTSASTIAPETLESDLLTHLASTSALEDLHATLLCSLQRLGWTEKIRSLSQELLRAGRCERFDEVVEAVVASAEGRKHPVLLMEEGKPDDDGGEGGLFDNVDVRIPEAVVEQGVRAIKEVLREVVILEDDADTTGRDGSTQNLNPNLNQNASAAEKQGGVGATEKDKDKKSSSSKSGGDPPLKNGDTSPVKKLEKKPKPGKQSK